MPESEELLAQARKAAEAMRVKERGEGERIKEGEPKEAFPYPYKEPPKIEKV